MIPSSSKPHQASRIVLRLSPNCLQSSRSVGSPVAKAHLALDATAQDLPVFGEEIEKALRHDSARSGRFPLCFSVKATIRWPCARGQAADTE
jgi:hypothetical protein